MVIISVFKKNLISALRGEYVDFVISRITFTAFTIATALILYKIYQGQVSDQYIQFTGGQNYLGFMIIGSALYGVTHSVFLNVSRTLMTERREGTLEAVFIGPFNRLQYYAGSQLTQLGLTGLDLVLSFGIALLLDVPLHFRVLPILAGFLLLWITLFGISLLTSLLMIRLRDTFFIQNTITPLLLLLGGYIFPVEFLPKPLQACASVLPLPEAVALVRQGFLARSASGFELSAYLIDISKALLLFAIGISLLRRVEQKAVENYLS